MKKYIIISIASTMLISACVALFFAGKPHKLELNQEEKKFIQNNRKNYFFMGYYVTPSEKLMIHKLCAQISDDTGLNISPFEGNWDDNITLLRSGKLSLLANMNITEDRLKYTNFTSSFEGMPIGVYSRYDNKIVSYESLKGKIIGIEKNVCLMDEFKMKYPEIRFGEKYYDNLDELKKALFYGEIDGFISSDSYSEDLRFYYFFKIDSLSKNNNHIGVSKNYPVLYSIMKKEVDYLIHTGWGQEVRSLVNLDIETRLVKLTDDEKKYIKEKEVLTIGIPKDYSYYAYGEPYYPQGIIPAFFRKIEFLTDLGFICSYDSYENLIKREDIDIIISPENLPFDSTAPIFFNELIAVSNGKWNVINEIYELEPYTIGMVNNTVLINDMKRMMPYLSIKIYKTYDELYNNLVKKKIDYAILPKKLFEKKKTGSNLANNGPVKRNFHYIYSKNNEVPLIDIINKCLPTINVDILMDEELSKLIQDEKPFYRILSFQIIMLAVIGIMIREIIKRIEIRNKQLYFDEETMLHNEWWLKDKLKLNYSDYVYFLVQPRNLKMILERYGGNAYKKALKVMITTLNDNIGNHEYVVKLRSNQFLIIKKKMTDQDGTAYMHKLKDLFNRRFTIFDINYSYEMDVVALKPEDEVYSLGKLLKELDIGLRYARYAGDAVAYTYEVYSKYQDKIDYDTRLSSAIMNEEVSLKLHKIVDHNGQLYGYDVSYSCKLDEWEEITFVNLKRSVKKLGLETIIDKIIFKKLLDMIRDVSYINTKIFIEVNKETIQSSNFFEWLKEKSESLENIQLFIKIDIDSYEKIFETVDHINNSQLDFVLSNFTQNLMDNTVIKDYEIPLVEIDAGLFSDLERNKEIIDFIVSFSRKYNKKILVSEIKTVNQYHAIKNYDIDYYVDILGGCEDESIDRRG
ncbi:transporter substrate-binding domain-containing protein [Petroclostridium sp. X23]|uniref:EAL domain-containing protein n=1 Tax=Petroclostridium sp. X23 TaxID=3045146 RepID=UPI0024AE64F9|nr:transporter substrate-binding domain-containing protein [Petroclostridium sp. X23]WHH60961.1 transporter substrate-binding domain-containing protein [Petroclostridium sp. X23]